MKEPFRERRNLLRESFKECDGVGSVYCSLLYSNFVLVQPLLTVELLVLLVE